MAYCRYHPDRPGIGVCMRCRATVCAACTTRLEGVNHCHACLKALGSRREEQRRTAEWWPPVAVFLGGVGVLVMFVFFLLFQGRLAP